MNDLRDDVDVCRRDLDNLDHQGGSPDQQPLDAGAGNPLDNKRDRALPIGCLPTRRLLEHRRMQTPQIAHRDVEVWGPRSERASVDRAVELSTDYEKFRIGFERGGLILAETRSRGDLCAAAGAGLRIRRSGGVAYGGLSAAASRNDGSRALAVRRPPLWRLEVWGEERP